MLRTFWANAAPKIAIALAFITATGLAITAHAEPTKEAATDNTGPASIAQLAGRWAGNGTLTLARGPAEPFKCVVTYFPNKDGTEMRQNLRCRGTENRLDTATNLLIAGDKISGQWQDNVYSLTGTVSGNANGQSFALLLNGDYFQATMVVESSGCEQVVRVVPVDTSAVKEVAARLSRC